MMSVMQFLRQESDRASRNNLRILLFQDATDIKLEILDEAKGDKKPTIASTGNKCYCNKGDVDKDHPFPNEFTYEEGDVYTKTYTKTNGFTLATTITPPPGLNNFPLSYFGLRGGGKLLPRHQYGMCHI